MAPLSVLVVCAMESEAVHLRRRLSDAEELESPAPRAWRISKGTLHGGAVEVRLLLCNIGEANAAGGTSAVLASGWRPEAVLNYGCAGAHDASIREGDVVSQLRLLQSFYVSVHPPRAGTCPRACLRMATANAPGSNRLLQSTSSRLTPACTIQTAPRRLLGFVAKNSQLKTEVARQAIC